MLKFQLKFVKTSQIDEYILLIELQKSRCERNKAHVVVFYFSHFNKSLLIFGESIKISSCAV